MENVVFQLNLAYTSGAPGFSQENHIGFSSFDEFKRFMQDPCSFWTKEEVEEFLTDCVYTNESYYYVDEDGNEIDLSEIGEDELLDYEVMDRPEEELQKILSDHLNEHNECLECIKKGNYTIDVVNYFSPKAWKFEDIKESIRLVKDKAKTIDLYNFSLDEITDIVNTIDINDDVELKTRFNYRDTCSKSELKELIDYLNNIKNYITRFDLSPLETCIFVHDLLREREYNENDHELEFHEGMTPEEMKELMDNQADSRSIMRVFKSDKIVCAGFSNLYSAILELVGIKSVNLTYLPIDEKVDNKGHMSNVVYLNDDEYGIQGLFEIDTTWGRIKNKDSSYNYQKSINNYGHFLRPMLEAKKIKRSKNLELYTPELALNAFEPCIKRIESLLKLQAPMSVMETAVRLLKNRCLTINNDLGCNFFEKELILLDDLLSRYNTVDKPSYDDFMQVFRRIYTKAYYPNINPFAFRDALYNVKMIEHSIDKDKYPFNMKDFNKAFNSRMDTPENRFIFLLSGSNQNLRMTQKRKLEIARMELISTLHKAAQDNVDKNPVHHV